MLSYLWSSYNPDSISTHQLYSKFSIYYNNYLKYFLFPIILIVTKLKKEFIPWLISSFIFGMFINEIISYGIFFELWSTERGTPENPVPFHINHITYSTFIGFTILLSIYKLVHIKNNYAKLFYLIFLTTMTINLFMSVGRTGQFALFITSMILIVIYFNKNIKVIVFSSFILLLTFFLGFSYMTTFNKRVLQAKQSIENIIDGKNVDTSLGTRIMAFHTIPYLVNRDNILIGVGIGDKASYVSSTLSAKYPYRLINFDKHGFLHNSHIEMLISNGLIGLFLYFSIFFFLFKLKIRDKFIQYIAYSISLYILCYGMVADIFFFHEVMSLFSLFLGIILTQIQIEHMKDTIDK